MYAGKAYLQAVLCSLLCLAGTTQVVAQTNTLESIAQGFDQHRKKALQEKLFLHLDRPVYACGETMWFKIYNVDGTLHKPLDLSKVAYVEVLDATQKPVLQGKVALNEGTGNGSFVLPATLNSGNYTVRAYTSWMKNFSPEFYFEQPVTIVNTFRQLDKPVITQASAYDIQFFPEGGNLVAGVRNRIAFKAVDQKTGKGIDFKGELLNQQGNKVADFTPYKFGIGNFDFTPVKGEKYTARVKLQGNTTFEQQLPDAFNKGYTLYLEDTETDRIKITVNQQGEQAEQIILLGHARQMVSVMQTSTIAQGAAVFFVDKDVLADGITHFTVFNSQKQPVSERLYFKRPAQTLQLDAKVAKQQYSPREKVNLDLIANTNTASTTSANLSMAVYRLDTLQGAAASSIESYVWLTSDLKGAIENPDYYFTGAGATDSKAIDNLMLTHGWSRFKWENILEKDSAPYRFLPENNGHFITGKVTHKTTGVPVPGITTYLAAPSKHVRLYNSISDANGFIRYEVKDFFGQKEIVVQSNFSKDSTYHFEIFNPFSDKFASRRLPVFTLSDELKQAVTSRHVQVQVQHAYSGGYSNRFKPAEVDSIAFYGKASEQYKLDDYKRFKVMEEVMREYVPGVQVRTRRGKYNFIVINRPYKTVFQESPMVLLDGVPVFDTDKIMALDPLKVNKLDVVTSRFFNGPLVYEGIVSYTTYKGDMAGLEPDPRALLQEYEGLQLEREFYAPVYESAEQLQSRLADFRNLLYWAPELKVKTGDSEKVAFYTSDQVGTYIVVLQGISGNGAAGSTMLKFNVNQAL